MFKRNFKVEADKHLSVFIRAASGLRAPQGAVLKRRQELVDAVAEHEKEIKELGDHHGELGSTLVKISALLPSSK